MNQIVRTVIYVGVAVGAGLVAALSSPGKVEPAVFSDVGEEFFPALVKADDATSLEVWEFDAATAEAVPFSVKKEKGTWIIPSHFDYPADAKDRMAKAAGLFIGLTKESVRSDRRDEHATFGVVDPTEPGTETEGRGMRVTFKDATGAVLADLIVGKEVEGRAGMRYVRYPDKKRTYTAKLPTQLTTKFEDWIERDLLKVSSHDMKSVVFDNYSIDEARRTIVPGEKVTMTKSGYDWTLPDLGPEEQIVKSKASDVASTLTGLEIVDVRRKPEGLTAQLENAQGISREILMAQLESRGYFVGGNGKLYSNEGDLIVNSSKGIVYTLKFGEIVLGDSDRKTDAGDPAKTEQEATDGAGGDAEKPKEGSRRYLMITAHFDESLLEKPAGEALPKEHMDKRKKAREEVEKIARAVETYRDAQGKLPETLAELTTGEQPPLDKLEKDPWDQDYALVKRPAPAKTEEPPAEGAESRPEGGENAATPEQEPFAVLSYAEDKVAGGQGTGEDLASDQTKREDDLAKTFADHEAYQKKVEDGKKEAARLGSRFGPWYYVIDAQSFAKLHLSRKDLIEPKQTEAEKTGSESATEGTEPVKNGAGMEK